MATDLASLSIKIENGDVIKTTTALNSMEVAGTKAEASTQRLTRRMALLEIQAREMDAEMTRSQTVMGKLAATMGISEAAATRLSAAFGAVSVIAAAGIIGRKFLEETELAQAAMAQLEAVVKSTGGAAGFTAAQMQEMAADLQRVTTFSDEAVSGAEALLATFTNIKGDNFRDATAAALDMSVALGQDVKASALQLGKALNDPVQGISALRRAGVQLSESQTDLVKDLVNTNRTAEAQRIILQEVAKQMGGSAAAARNTLGGALAGLKNDFGDLFEQTKEQTSATVALINALDSGVRSIHTYSEELKALGLALGGVAVAFGAATLAGRSFALQAVLGGAATAAEGLALALSGVATGVAVALGPIALLAGAGALAIYDLNKAFDDYDDKVEEASKNTKEYVEYLKALGRAHAHAPEITPSTTTDLTDEARKFAALVESREQELGKLRALNAAYRESSVALALLGIQYDAAIQKSQDAKDHHGRELATLDALTDSIARQKAAQVLLNDQLEREARLRSVRAANADALRSANESVILAGQDSATAERTRNRFDELNKLQDAERKYHDDIRRATAQQRADAKTAYDETVARIHKEADLNDQAITKAREAATALSVGLTVADTEAQTRGIRAMVAAELEGGKAVEQMSIQLAGNEAVQRAVNDATSRGTTITEAQAAALRGSAEEMERARIEAAKLQAVFRQVSDVANQVFTDLFHGKNPFPGLAKYVEEQVIRGLSDAVARPITVKIAKILGIEAPASQQERAAKVMKDAADKQLQAAQIMAGAAPGGDVATQQFAAQFTDPVRPTPTIVPSTGAHPGTGTGETSKSVLDMLQSKLPESLARALAGARAVAGPALAGYGIGLGAGEAAYSTSHGTVGNYARGALGGAAAGALAGSAFGPVGAAVGAVTGFIGGIVGVGHAAKDAAKQTEELRKALSLTMDDLRATVGKDAVAASIAQVNAQREQIRKQIEDAYSGGGANSDTVRERNKQLAELNRLEDERIRQLKEEAATMQQRQIEDYRVRQLRAEGKTKEADDLAFREQQERERQDLVTSFGDVIDAKEAEILASYDAAAAAEKAAYASGKLTGAFNDLTTSVRGGPSGYKLNGYIQEFATGRPLPASPTPWTPATLAPGLPIPQSPQFSQSNTGKVATAPVVLQNPVFNFPNITDGKAAAKAFLAELDKTKNAAFGLNGTRAQALERMPS